MKRTAGRAALVLLLVLAAPAAHARIGGGDSYSSGSPSYSDSSSSYSDSSSSYSDSSSSYSGSSDSYSSSDYSSYGNSSYGNSSRPSSGSPAPRRRSGGRPVSSAEVAVLMFGLVCFGAMSLAAAEKYATTKSKPVRIAPAEAPRPGAVDMAALRAIDPNFSEIVFTDFCYSLFARLHEARGRGRVDDLAPYVAAEVRERLKRRSPKDLIGVNAIVIGSFTVVDFRHTDGQWVEADVEFDANYTEVIGPRSRRFYVREVWTLTRLRNVLSPRPEKARAAHCPKCGAALGTDIDGACLHCRTIVDDGLFDWFVQWIDEVNKTEQPPRIGGSPGEEPGLDRPTVAQPSVRQRRRRFAQRHPGFTWEAFDERVRHVATELQNAWTSRDWHRARPYETDALFQTHRYWIDEYRRQKLRNVVEGYTIDRIEVAKVMSDAFYDAITVRLFASGTDYTIDEEGVVVGGNRRRRRSWSEYWTFIHGRAGAPADARNCPNCGGALAEGQTAVCAYCGGKVMAGEFPWVLSRIEQDEVYRG